MKPFLITLITMGATILVAEDRAGVTSPPGTNIVSNLEQIVSLRQQAAQRHAALVSANRVPYDSAFEIALAKAQLDLARERRADEECLKALSQLVALRRKDLAFEKSLLSSDRRSSELALTEASVALLRAEIDLEREVQKQKARK